MQERVGGSEPLVLQGRIDPAVALVTLNRPAARNALSRDLIADLQEAIDAAGRDRAVAAIILAANGPVFSAGHDLKELTARRADPDGGKGFFSETMTACAALMQAIVACPKPVIAAVQGTATAAGCQLVATCDLAVAAHSAEFATPGVNIGLFCSTPMVALSRNVAPKRAMEMLLLGAPITAETAAAYGLINRAVPKDQVLSAATEIARSISAKSKATVALGKSAYYRQREMPLADAYAFAAQVMVENVMSADAEEGICAFVEKRAPTWKET